MVKSLCLLALPAVLIFLFGKALHLSEGALIGGVVGSLAVGALNLRRQRRDAGAADRP
jgi:hypothetical protein